MCNIKNIGNDTAELKTLVYYLESKLFCFAVQSVPIMLTSRKSSKCLRQQCPLFTLKDAGR